VKNIRFIGILTSILLILTFVLSACGGATETTVTATKTVTATPTTATTTATPTVKYQAPVYKVLNPAGTYIPVDCIGLSKRLDSLAGKTILFYEAEATNMQLPTLLARLKKDYPTATFNVVYTELWGERVPTDAYKLSQACIRGVGW
jgi:hypothetical protein